MDAALTLDAIESIVSKMNDMDTIERIHAFVTISGLIKGLAECVEKSEKYSGHANVQSHFHLYAGEILRPLECLSGLETNCGGEISQVSIIHGSLEKLRSSMCFDLCG